MSSANGFMGWREAGESEGQAYAGRITTVGLDGMEQFLQVR